MLPAALTPCLSSAAASDLKELISVSNAVSQVALLLKVRTVFDVSVISSPKGSAVWTGAVAGGFGASAVGFAGVCTSAGGGDRRGRRCRSRRGRCSRRGGGCRRRRAGRCRRRRLGQHGREPQGSRPPGSLRSRGGERGGDNSFKGLLGRAGMTLASFGLSRHNRRNCAMLTRELSIRPMTDMSCRSAAGVGRRYRFALTVASDGHTGQPPRHSPYKVAEDGCRKMDAGTWARSQITLSAR